jgi:hypothetical protein
MMQYMSFALAITACATGIVAAVYWYRASAVKVAPATKNLIVGGGMATGTEPFLTGVINATKEASALNRIAAIWTALSVGLSGISTMIGQWPF